MMVSNAERQLYTTIVGVGVDFNTDLIESITKMRGANYYSVHSPAEFVRRMDEGFDYMVTPLVFDLRLQFDSPDAEIEQVYGSPEADAAAGDLLYVNTLFPSDSQDGEVKGGLVLLKLRRNVDSGSSAATLTATYRDRRDQLQRNESIVALLGNEAEHYDHAGIRKGILLARYAGLVKDWLAQEAGTGLWRAPSQTTEPTPRIWERQSSPLYVPRDYRRAFADFAAYFEVEMEAIGDETLRQELELLERLAQ